MIFDSTLTNTTDFQDLPKSVQNVQMNLKYTDFKTNVWDIHEFYHWAMKTLSIESYFKNNPVAELEFTNKIFENMKWVDNNKSMYIVH